MPPVYPYDKLAELAGSRAAGTRAVLVDLSSAPRATRRRARSSRRSRSSGAERGYPSSMGSGGVPRGRPRMDVPPVRCRHRRVGRRGAASAPRSSSPAFPTGCDCARPGATRCSARGSPTRPTRWAPSSPGAVRSSVPARPDGTMDLSSISPEDAARALCLWVNSPGNPRRPARGPGAGGALGPLARRAGLLRRVLRRVHLERAGPHDPRHRGRTASSRCTRSRKGRTSPGCGLASTPATRDLVGYLSRLRQHAGFMVPGPVQHAGAVALGDDLHVERQRGIYLGRLEASRRGSEPERDRGRGSGRVLLPLGGGPRGFRSLRRLWGGEPGLGADALARESTGVSWWRRVTPTGRPGPATSASPSCSRTSGSSLSPGGSRP